MRETFFRVITIGAIAGLLVAAGCGDEAEPTTEGPVAEAPKASEFPKPEGRTLDEILTSYAPNEEIVLASAGAVFDGGPSRFAFGVFDVSRAPISDAAIALYAASDCRRSRDRPFPSANREPRDRRRLRRAEHLQRSRRREDGLRQRGRLRHRRRLEPGRPDPRGNTYTASRVTPSIKVGQFKGIPAVGEEAPSIHTPTLEDVTNVEEIDTRQPPTTQHEDDLADVLGKEPVVLTFATPRLCASRVCGPVADVAEQVKSEYGDEAAFIHMEIYNDNEVDKGLRPEVQAFGLPTEPWVFVIDRNGVVSERFEGALSVSELTDALQQVL